jgi:hypothetical protein
MNNAQARPLRKLTAVLASLMLSMMLIPNAFAQGNLQIRAPQFEVMPSSYASVSGPRVQDDARVQFVSATVEHNVEVDGIRGLRLHINFIIQDPVCPCQIIAWFYNDDDGTRLVGSYPANTDKGGKVAVWKKFEPDINPAQYKDFTLWIPNKALNLEESGSVWNLRFRLGVFENGNKTQIGNSKFYLFKFIW